jgi:glycosyltransferase involved in cell wall biosynthesis
VKVCHVITDMQTGGEASVMSWLLPALSERGVESTVIAMTADAHTPVNDDTFPMRSLRAAGIPVVDLGVRSRGDVLAVGKLARTLRAARPHVVHTYLFHAGVVARPLTKMVLPDVPIVASSVSTDPWHGALSSQIEMSTLRLASVIVANADAVARRLVERAPYLRSRVIVQRNSIQVSRFSNAGSEAALLPEVRGPVVLVAGRLSHEKGPDLAVKAMVEIRRELAHAHLVFVGDGPMRPVVQDLAQTLGLSDAVSFVGAVPHDQMARAYGQADVVLIPSRWEGLPAVLLEAMASGVACVSTRVGGVAEVVADGACALMVEPEDVHAIAKACTRLLTEGPLREGISRSAVRRAQEFDAPALIHDRERLYRSLVPGRA